MTLRILIYCLLAMVLAEAKAQDPVFSQFYNAPNQINPAFVGNTVGPLVASNYRLQWPGFSLVYNTYMLSYDKFSPRFNSGFGTSILVDDAGDGALKTTKLSGLYSYRIFVRNETFIKFGLEMGLVQSRLDPSKLIFFDQLDPQYGSVSPGGTTIPTQENISNIGTRFYPDVGAGIMIYSSKFYGGIGLKHLNNPDNGFLDNIENIDLGIPTRFTLHAGMQIDLEKGNNRLSSAFISPNIVFVKQGPFHQINAGAHIDFGAFFTGLWYRDTANNGDAVIGSLGVRSGIYKISYSYDLTVSGLGVNSGGSHELGLILNFDSLLPKKSKYNDCLNLFR
ncbi:MAG: PorP/SprF family type IX secretion system membrane protein [Saprospiraceae bacterium]|nr:PorP/SprF family type IX secretion system membrane protein [Saprospiraceae bacterium]